MPEFDTYNRIVAFDVETPNSHNDRISSIGIAVIEGGKLVDTYTSLVDPETYFNRFNIWLTGITPEMVKDAPAFPKLWEEIGPILQSGLLIAHNAPFDMRVLAGCLQHYRIDAPAQLNYACTVRMGKKCYPELPDHKLDTLCHYRDIALDHHKADSDSLACAKLCLDYMEHGLDIAPFVRTYDVRAMKTLTGKHA